MSRSPKPVPRARPINGLEETRVDERIRNGHVGRICQDVDYDSTVGTSVRPPFHCPPNRITDEHDGDQDRARHHDFLTPRAYNHQPNDPLYMGNWSTEEI
jgi:hypothetical protein